MTCPFCDSHSPRSFGEHLQVSDKGITVAGPCTTPDDFPGQAMKPDTFRERLAAVTERLRAPVVAAILAPVNPNAPRSWNDDEEDDR